MNDIHFERVESSTGCPVLEFHGYDIRGVHGSGRDEIVLG